MLKLSDEVDLQTTLRNVMGAVLKQYAETDTSLHETRLFVSRIMNYQAQTHEVNELDALLLTLLHAVKPENIDENEFLKTLLINLGPVIEGYEVGPENETTTEKTSREYDELLSYFKELWSMLKSLKITDNNTDSFESMNYLEKLLFIGTMPTPRPGTLFIRVFNEIAGDIGGIINGDIDKGVLEKVAKALSECNYEKITEMFHPEICSYSKSIVVLMEKLFKHSTADSVMNILRWFSESGDFGMALNALDLMSPQDFGVIAYNIQYLPVVISRQSTPLNVVDLACAMSRDTPSVYDNGVINFKRMDNVINKFQHESVAEHLIYTFEIENVSRALLQELARHRMGSFTVKSTRYTLNELKKASPFILGDYASKKDLKQAASRFILLKGDNDAVDDFNIKTLEGVRERKAWGMSNDDLKYCLPEAYLTHLVWTVNLRSLRNFLRLRSDKSALYEIRLLANTVYAMLPIDHLFLVKDSLVYPK